MEETLKQILGELTLIRQKIYEQAPPAPAEAPAQSETPAPIEAPAPEKDSEPETAPDLETLKRLFTHGVNVGKKQELKSMLESKYGVAKLIELPESKRLECYDLAEGIINGNIPF